MTRDLDIDGLNARWRRAKRHWAFAFAMGAIVASFGASASSPDVIVGDDLSRSIAISVSETLDAYQLTCQTGGE